MKRARMIEKMRAARGIVEKFVSSNLRYLNEIRYSLKQYEKFFSFFFFS